MQQTVFSGEPVVDPVDLVALDADTGERLWTRRVDITEIGPTLTGDLVLTPEPDGATVTARSPRTGAERWSLPMPAGHHCTFTTAGAGTYAHCRPVTRDAKAANSESRVLVVDRADGSARTVKVPLNSVLSARSRETWSWSRTAPNTPTRPAAATRRTTRSCSWTWRPGPE